VQTFLFHQFSLLLLLVPIVSATALATHAVIGEKQSRALEPLLATPISTIELLAAKALTPFRLRSA
jgi:ABC-2 type transport system permease protein